MELKIRDVLTHIAVFVVSYLGTMYLIMRRTQARYDEYVADRILGSETLSFLGFDYGEIQASVTGDTYNIIFQGNDLYTYLPWIIAGALTLLCLIITIIVSRTLANQY